MSHPKRKLPPELDDLGRGLNSEPSEPLQAPFETGRRAGAAVRRLLLHRGDHITTSVEWYRGFCNACGKTPDPKVEAFIAKEIQHVAIQEDARQRTAVISAMATAHIADITEVLEAPEGKRRQ